MVCSQHKEYSMKYWLNLIFLLFCSSFPAHAEVINYYYDTNPTYEKDNYFAQQCAPQQCSPLCYHPLRFSVRGIAGEGMGHDTSRASADIFFAPSNDCEGWEPFVIVRGNYLSHHRWAASAGFGLRWSDDCFGRVWGANFFYDYREIHEGQFNQIGAGLESLGACFDFRINGYFPIGSKEHSSSFVVINESVGPPIKTCRKLELAKTGANAEVGMNLFRCGQLEFYGAMGAYYYRHKNFVNFWGGSARFLTRYTDYLSLEVRVTYDRDFHTKTQGIFTISIPFDCFNYCAPCHSDAGIGRCLLWSPVVRNEVIIIDHVTHCNKKN